MLSTPRPSASSPDPDAARPAPVPATPPRRCPATSTPLPLPGPTSTPLLLPGPTSTPLPLLPQANFLRLRSAMERRALPPPSAMSPPGHAQVADLAPPPRPVHPAREGGAAHAAPRRLERRAPPPPSATRAATPPVERAPPTISIQHPTQIAQFHAPLDDIATLVVGQLTSMENSREIALHVEEEMSDEVLPEARAAERGGDSVVVAGEHVVEPRVGALPVYAGGLEQPLCCGRRPGAHSPSAREVDDKHGQTLLIPQVEMSFESEDDAYEMYNSYAKKVPQVIKGKVSIRVPQVIKGPKTKRCRNVLEKKKGKNTNTAKKKGEDPKNVADGREGGQDPMQLTGYFDASIGANMEIPNFATNMEIPNFYTGLLLGVDQDASAARKLHFDEVSNHMIFKE